MSKLYFLGNSTKSQMLGFVLVSEGKTAVVDGGTFDDYKQLSSLLLELSGGKVDAWFFTHPHHDHIGAFGKIVKHAEKITIDAVYHSFPTIDDLKAYESRYEGEVALWNNIFSIFDGVFSGQVHTLNSGDIFKIGAVNISVLRTYNPEIKNDFINNSSTVYRVDGENRSVLILGDLGKDGGDDVIARCDRESLIADYTQMAHHGQGGVKRDFYEYIRPQRCIWPSPEWLYNNDAGDGFDTGPWLTVRTREWMRELGAMEHIVEKDGTQVIEI